ncbi:MAG: Ig-like domain-containing protein [Gemmatimonadota bacterium]
MTISADATTLVVGQSAQARAVARDAGGNSLVDQTISWKSSDASIVSVSSGGMLTGTAPGDAVITATAASRAATLPLTVRPKPVIRVSVTLAASSITVGQTTTAVAAALDADNAVLGNRVIIWDSSNNAIARVSTSGVVTGVSTGTVTISALSEGVRGSATLVVVALPVATSLSLTTAAPASVVDGVPFTQQPIVRLMGSNGSPVNLAGVNVTAAIASGGGTLNGTTTVTTDASGVARFTDLSISGAVGTRTLVFTAPSLTAATTGSISVTQNPLTRLMVVTQPSYTTASGVPFPQQPAIQLRDESGGALNQAGVVISASLASTNAVLGGTTTATTNSSGIASFTNLKISGTIGMRVLSFSAPNFGTTNSSVVGITAGAAAKLAVSVQPSSAAASGDALTVQPVVALTDEWGNPVFQAGLPVTVALASGTGTLSGAASAMTNASGAAFFSGLTLTGSGVHTLKFSSGALTLATSAGIALVSPIKNINFDGYTSTAQMIADCVTFRCSEQNLTDSAGVKGFVAGEISLDQSTGPPGNTKSMRYHYLHPGDGCNSITLRRSVLLKPVVQEVWGEFRVKWSSNFTVSNKLCSPNGHKFIFGDTESDFNYRWAFYVGADEPGQHALREELPSRPGIPGGNYWLNRNPRGTPGETRPEQLWDGNWHTIRLHMRASSTPTSADGRWQIWVDGKLLHDDGGFSTYRNDGTNAPDMIEGFSFAHNKDDGPPGIDMYVWWGTIRVFTGNPGW